ncbi:MAG: hypothetical protein IJS82_05090 [Paludibacteraceae bacterium]|nr:hypothetical protein [Paludibacteraceae bacterium]
MDTKLLETWLEEYLRGTEYELVTLKVSPQNDILVEVDRLAGVDVDFCAELNRFLVEKLEGVQNTAYGVQTELDYSLEVGSYSLTEPFKTKMQYQKNLGHDVEVMVCTTGQSTKYKGLLVSVDEETFSVDVLEKVKPTPTPSLKGGEKVSKRPIKQIVTYTWRYDEPKYVKYDLKF